MTESAYNKLMTPRAYGASFDPPYSERAVYRWMAQPDGLPFIELPNGARRIDPEIAAEYLKNRVRRTASRRQGRAASKSEAA